ncbi:MAG: hypothetical protein MJ180_05280 [Candidatus Gastranaerophilales bacterium]|nr:hypothetical protein [Candidatus Gastranaerophilales bacterium]
MPVKLLWGYDEYNINTELEKIRKSVLTKDFAQLNTKVLREKSLKEPVNMSDVVELIETTPMMFGNLLIEVHSTALFTRGKTENEKVLERLVNNLKDLSENIYVVFVCIFSKDDDKKVDSAKKLVKTIKEVGEIQEFEPFKSYETDKIIQWLMKKVKEKKIVLSVENAKILLNYVGCDLRTLDNELEKLKTYILPSNEIKADDIITLSQDNEDAFKILDLWLKDDKVKMLEEFNKLIVKDAPERVIALFETTAKKWLRIKLESEYSSNSQEIAKIIGAHPFVIQKEMEKLRSVSKEKLLNLRKNLNEAEFQMKSGQITSNTSIEMALVK